jgi:hypothetical protein
MSEDGSQSEMNAASGPWGPLGPTPRREVGMRKHRAKKNECASPKLAPASEQIILYSI